jgi:hypothetical protein
MLDAGSSRDAKLLVWNLIEIIKNSFNAEMRNFLQDQGS